MKILAKIFSLTCFITVMSVCSVTQAHVLDGAIEWNGHYYKVFQMQMTWYDADKFCKSMGGHLVTAETQEENEILKRILWKSESNRYKQYWYGGFFNDNSGWMWVTGVSINYSDWINGANFDKSSPLWNPEVAISVWCGDNPQWSTSARFVKYCPFCEWESASAAHESNM